jgi:hypothetical protein
MKMNVEMEKQLLKVQAGFNRFVHDILPIANAKVGVPVAPPTVKVLIVPESYWSKLRNNIWSKEVREEEWMSAKAVAVYTPASFEVRLRALTELQLKDHAHNYDKDIDYNAMIFLRQGTRIKGNEEHAVLEIYAALASACFSLAIATMFGRFSVCPIANPFSDKNAEEAMGTLTATLTPEEFARRYGLN